MNTETGRIDIADSERHREIDGGSWFWIEGVREELDEPGEWFLDVENGRLYTMPEPGVDPNTLEFIAPFLNRIINAQGDVNAGTHVSHVHIDGGCIHFATMNRLAAPNFILNNWLHDIWGHERLPDGSVKRRLANGIFLDWDTSNTTVKNNWIHNSVGGAIKPIWQNWNLVIEDNSESDTPITPPFADQVGPDGTATHGIDLESTRLTGSVIHHSDARHVSTTGTTGLVIADSVAFVRVAE